MRGGPCERFSRVALDGRLVGGRHPGLGPAPRKYPALLPAAAPSSRRPPPNPLALPSRHVASTPAAASLPSQPRSELPPCHSRRCSRPRPCRQYARALRGVGVAHARRRAALWAAVVSRAAAMKPTAPSLTGTPPCRRCRCRCRYSCSCRCFARSETRIAAGACALHCAFAAVEGVQLPPEA